MADQLSDLYAEFLEGHYDCVDRVVLNAYFGMGQTPGGFRVWWRELYGSDENLDDNHLMRMAGRFSRRLRAWAKANGISVIYCSPDIFVSVQDHLRAKQEKSTFQYQYSVFQMEYSRNLLFHSGRQMEEIFQALIDRTRAPLDLDRIQTIFGDKHRPHYDKRKNNPTRWGVVVETPTYDLTVFKVHYGKMTLKIYSKGARVLRVEVIVHNTREYRWGRSLSCFGEIVTRLREILERFLNAIGCMDACMVADETLENLPLPTQVGQTKVGGIDFNKPRMRRVAEAVLALSTAPAGFTASELAQKVRAMSGETESAYGPRRAAYDLKKLRGKGMVRKIGTSRRYEPEPDGLRAMTALVVLREKVIRPLLAASQRPESQIKPNHPTPVDHHYEHLRVGMRDLFTALGMAA